MHVYRGAGTTGGSCPPALVLGGDGGKNALFNQDEEIFQSTLLPSSIMTLSNLTKFTLQCLFDFRCFKIQQLLHEIAQWPHF